MSTTPIQIQTDLSQVLARIEQKIDALQKDVNDLKVGQARLEERLTGEIKTLEAKVDGISKRLDTQEFINRSVVVGLILAITAGVIKLFFPDFPNN